jgi:hypothetical protein
MIQLNLLEDVEQKNQKMTNASPEKQLKGSSEEGFFIIMIDETIPYIIHLWLGTLVILLLIIFAIYLKLVGVLFPEKQWFIDHLTTIDLTLTFLLMIVVSIHAFLMAIINTICSIVTKVRGMKDKIKEYKFNNDNKNNFE